MTTSTELEMLTPEELQRELDQLRQQHTALRDELQSAQKQLGVKSAELAQSHEYQAAISRVLEAISRAPGAPQAALDLIVESAGTICDSFDTGLLLKDGDSLVARAHSGPIPLTQSRFIDASTVPGRAILSRKPVQEDDLAVADHAYATGSALARSSGTRTALAVPLLQDGEPTGCLFLRRSDVRPFSARQISLLEAFASQAVIAIENARLFGAEQARKQELQESLEFQTAISEVLGAIAQTRGDVGPVIRKILEAGLRLAEADTAVMRRKVGEAFPIIGYRARTPEDQAEEQQQREYWGSDLPLNAQQAVTTKQTIHNTNIGATRPDFVERFGQRVSLAIPMLRDDEIIGVLNLARHGEKPFTRSQIALVETFADQAVIAIENAQLLSELKTRQRDLEENLERQTATSELLELISSSPRNLAPIFQQVLEKATTLCNAKFGNLFLIEDGGLRHVAMLGVPSEFVALRRNQPLLRPGPKNALAKLLASGQVQHVEDVRLDEAYLTRDKAAVEIAEVAGARTMLMVPMLKGKALVGVIGIFRQEVRPFSHADIELVSGFARQAVIAIENARLLDELRSREHNLTESLEYQTATSEVLGVISRSPSELQPVLDAIAATANRICEADYTLVFRMLGCHLHLAASYGADPETHKWLAERPLIPGRNSVAGRATVTKQIVHLPDALTDADFGTFERQQITRARTSLGVPLLRDGAPIGVIVLVRTHVRPFQQSQVDLVRTFADQAIIAINNVGLFEEVQARTKELQEALEYQTAISDVLGVISRSPNELQPVLDTIVATAQRLCEGDRAQIFIERNGQFTLASHSNTEPHIVAHFLANPILPGRSTATARAALEGRTVHVPDVMSDPDYDPEGFHTMLGGARLVVPLKRADRTMGLIAIPRRVPTPFTERQIALVTTFADQAVIAINNVSLFEQVQSRSRELQEALEDQTATAEILSVITRTPTDSQPVFQAIAKSTRQLTGAAHGSVYTFDGEQIHLIAFEGAEAEGADALIQSFPQTPGRTGATSRAVETGQVHYIADVLADPDYAVAWVARTANYRSIVSVPMLREGRPIGAITASASAVGAFTDKKIELLKTFANQAVIAMNNVDLFNQLQVRQRDLEVRSQELTRSVDELQSLSEVGQAVSSSLEMTEVLQTILKNAVRMANAGGGTVYVYDKTTEEFLLAASLNMSEEHIARVRTQPIRMGDPVVGECAEQRQAVQIEDLTQDDARRSLLLDILLRAGVRSIMAVPLLRQDEVIGALVIRRGYPGRFTPETVRLLEAFAAQSAIAINNARLFKEVEKTGQALAVASQHKSQFVANMSHELRTPLAAMLGYTELLADGTFGDLPAPAVRTLDRVQANGKHLLGLINAVLDISKIEAGQFSLNLDDYAIGSLVETVRVATESLASAKGLQLYTEVAPQLPHGFGDEQRLTQVLLNLVGNAIKFTDTGEVRVVAYSEDDAFAIDVRDTGPGIPPNQHARIFEEFHQVDNTNTKMKGGTGLGLAISKQIVEMHGGRIWVDSTVGEGATFHMRLPIRVTAHGAAA